MAAGGYPHAEAARGRIEAPCRRLVPFQLVLKQVGSNKLERHLFDPEPNGASEIWFGVEQIVFRLEPNESTFHLLNGSRPDESIRSALDYGDLSETFARLANLVGTALAARVRDVVLRALIAGRFERSEPKKLREEFRTCPSAWRSRCWP